ncbi:MAG: hypothetical protein M5U12_11440 [Verrucomicrobia bacterium]|nr:hypothetical protein [Verrucomicrobiota bacterium]
MSWDQFWSIFAMPIGLMICFGPMVVAWLAAERKSATAAKKPVPRQRH